MIDGAILGVFLFALGAAAGMALSEYPITLPVANHDQVGWSDWTHPTL